MVCKLNSDSNIHAYGIDMNSCLFYTWRQFHFCGNAETIDNYVTCMLRAVALLGLWLN